MHSEYPKVLRGRTEAHPVEGLLLLIYGIFEHGYQVRVAHEGEDRYGARAMRPVAVSPTGDILVMEVGPEDLHPLGTWCRGVPFGRQERSVL